MQLDPTFVKLVAWFDNEWGYANKLLDVATIVARRQATSCSWPFGELEYSPHQRALKYTARFSRGRDRRLSVLTFECKLPDPLLSPNPSPRLRRPPNGSS
jgi:hypothetical protein